MLIFDFHKIGANLYAIRKKLGMTQAEVAEASGLSDRAYAEIERGTVNMRVETILRICQTLHISPDEVLTEEAALPERRKKELLDRMESCSPKERDTALLLLSVYLESLT